MKRHYSLNDRKYYEKYHLSITEKRKSEDALIMRNAMMQLGLVKKPKLVDSSYELESEKVNYKLEMIYR